MATILYFSSLNINHAGTLIAKRVAIKTLEK